MILEKATQLLSLEPSLIQQRISALDQGERLYGIQAYDHNQKNLGGAYQYPPPQAQRNASQKQLPVSPTPNQFCHQ